MAAMLRTGAMILLTLSAVSSSNIRPLAKISGCVIQSVAANGGFVLIRRWVVTNSGDRTIDATRAGISEPGQSIAENSPGGAVWDDEVPLSPGEAHVVVEPPTDPIASRLYSEPTPFACKIVAVRYTDGSVWAAGPFFGPIPRHVKRTFDKHA